MKNNNNIFNHVSYIFLLSIILIFLSDKYKVKSSLLFPIEYIQSKNYKFLKNNSIIKEPE